MPRGFNFPDKVDVWLPIEAYDPDSTSRTARGRRVIARLRDGVALDQARAELSAIGKQIRQENSADIDLVDMAATSLQEKMVGDVRQSLLVMTAAVAFLLLVACANVANLILAQATARQREFSVRAALGATRWRLARQFITENLALSLIAGGLGVLIAFWGVDALINLNHGKLPRADEINVDARALVFTFSPFVAGGDCAGPVAFRSFRRSRSERAFERRRSRAIRERRKPAAARRACDRADRIDAGFVGRRGAAGQEFFQTPACLHPGFRTESAVAMEMLPPSSEGQDSAQRRASFYQQMIERAGALPGVTAVGGVNGLPMAGWERRTASS